MSEQRGSLCYIIQENRDSPLYLCVMDSEKEDFHRFPISVSNASRLAYECSSAVNAAIGGHSDKHSFVEVAAVLSKKFKPL